jgi:hypothetical protein
MGQQKTTENLKYSILNNNGNIMSKCVECREMCNLNAYIRKE